MTVSEFKKAVEKHQKKEELQKEAVTIEASHITSEPIELNGLVSIYEYIYNQDKGWQKVDKERLPEYLQESVNFFSKVKKEILKFLEFYDRQFGYDNQRWNRMKRQISLLSENNNYIFPFNVPETKFLMQLHENFPKSVAYAVSFLANKAIEYRSFNQDKLTGILQAYEFKQQDNALVSRRNSEEKSLSQLRSAYNKYINKAKTEVDTFTNKTIEFEKTKFRKWYFQTEKDFDTFEEKAKQTILDLETTYRDKLKLEAPAQYWNDRAVKLKKEGKNWLIALIVCSTTAIVSLGTVLYFISDGTLKDLFTSSASAIRWSIVFITFVSFLAFAIRIFSKLTFSSYHLVRDAEEREQLAYVFLALKKEKNIDATQEHLIMQSLFSRADSGLLKDDASPTMPGGSMIEKIIGGK
ncbi:DUF6161 domain-containing protein [Pontimicrobium sp. MEBiC01747]